MDWINLVIIPAVKSIVLVIVLLTGFAYLTWVERKLLGRFQLRYGPNRAWRFGLGHPIADALKMIFKEEIIPGHVDKVIYVLGPALAIAPALAMFAVVPVGPDLTLFGRTIPMVVADVNVGLLYVLAMAGVGAYGVILGGWASNNKYSLLGALRTSSQMLSYELPMGIMLIAILLMTGTLSLVGIVNQTLPWYFRAWILLAFPFYFITVLAETNRSPFDLPETENELVAGFQTEYGGIKFALYYMTEYLHMIAASGVVVTLFFGGWRGPFVEQAPVLGVAYFAAKVLAMIFLFIWVRASLPRVRYDQLLKFCWTFLFPLSLVYLAITAVAVVFL
ncbi:MAG: NADH-quinone oxidoreductase subunit NuoH [Chloroflexi bacterium HGW-Chloroflexi-1]|nr:MAG: NADH-quinone oxidoreductase subunit NuoH [Chloroflexi bacterium HGW-Chloroflexi-1]